MALFIISFVAGVLTVAAPCILPLLPIIIGGSVTAPGDKRSFSRPLVITASLVVSVIVFSLLLKASTTLLGVPQMVWQIASGGIVLLLGIDFLWPQLYEQVSARSGFFTRTNVALGSASKKGGLLGAILMGAALGPVFSSCSPTYALIVATILPASFLQGLAYLAAYALGLGVVLLLIAFAGQALVTKLRWMSNPKGWFKRILGILFILVGLSVIFGLDKAVQAFVLEQGWYDAISSFERSLEQ